MRLALLLLFGGALAFLDTVAVLPFWSAASTPKASLDWIGESIAETVRDALGSRNVLALEREDTAEAFTRLGLRERMAISEGSVVKLGQELDAEHVIFGTFDFTPNGATGAGAHGSLKIAARILDLKRLRLGPAVSIRYYRLAKTPSRSDAHRMVLWPVYGPFGGRADGPLANRIATGVADNSALSGAWAEWGLP
jgi:hypothetical protein